MTRAIRVTEVKVDQGNSIITIAFDLQVDLTKLDPICPATLYRDEDARSSLLDLHRLLSIQGQSATCISFDSSTEVVVGETYFHQGWWSTSAYRLVTDRTRLWTLAKYPDDSDHDHCPLTWKKISTKNGEAFGYCSGDDWISVEAFEKYIRDDLLGVRQT